MSPLWSLHSTTSTKVVCSTYTIFWALFLEQPVSNSRTYTLDCWLIGNVYLQILTYKFITFISYALLYCCQQIKSKLLNIFSLLKHVNQRPTDRCKIYPVSTSYKPTTHNFNFFCSNAYRVRSEVCEANFTKFHQDQVLVRTWWKVSKSNANLRRRRSI